MAEAVVRATTPTVRPPLPGDRWVGHAGRLPCCMGKALAARPQTPAQQHTQQAKHAQQASRTSRKPRWSRKARTPAMMRDRTRKMSCGEKGGGVRVCIRVVVVGEVGWVLCMRVVVVGTWRYQGWGVGTW